MIAFSNLTKLRRPRLAWEKIKNYVLGKEYELSVVFAEDKILKDLNYRYRKKNSAASILSFSLSKKEGEIFINLKKVEKEDMALFYVHSLLHLKGFKHGVKMERKEKEIMKKFHGNGK